MDRVPRGGAAASACRAPSLRRARAALVSTRASRLPAAPARRGAAVLGAAVVLAACALYEPLDRVAPRRRDPVPEKILRSVAWAGGAVAMTTVAVAAIPVFVLCATAQDRAHDAATDDALRGGPSPMDARTPVFDFR